MYCDDNGGIDVEVTNSSTLPTFFGRVLGVDELTPAGRAVAQINGGVAYSGLRP